MRGRGAQPPAGVTPKRTETRRHFMSYAAAPAVVGLHDRVDCFARPPRKS